MFVVKRCCSREVNFLYNWPLCEKQIGVFLGRLFFSGGFVSGGLTEYGLCSVVAW